MRPARPSAARTSSPDHRPSRRLSPQPPRGRVTGQFLERDLGQLSQGQSPGHVSPESQKPSPQTAVQEPQSAAHVRHDSRGASQMASPQLGGPMQDMVGGHSGSHTTQHSGSAQPTRVSLSMSPPSHRSSPPLGPSQRSSNRSSSMFALLGLLASWMTEPPYDQEPGPPRRDHRTVCEPADRSIRSHRSGRSGPVTAHALDATSFGATPAPGQSAVRMNSSTSIRPRARTARIAEDPAC